MPHTGRKDKETKLDASLLFPTKKNDNYAKTKFKIIKRANQLFRRFISNEVLIDFPNHNNNTAKKALEYFLENSYFYFKIRDYMSNY